jgi:hypothetical protein
MLNQMGPVNILMNLSKRIIILIAFCVIVLSSLFVAPMLLQQPKDLEHAVPKAIRYFKDSHEPYALLWLDVIYRRFGITEFADALQRYDQIISEKPDKAPVLRVFRRIADYDNPLQEGDLDEVSDYLDRITVPALYCDRVEPSSGYSRTLTSAASNGEYTLTHALLALIWLQENGGEVWLPDNFMEDVYFATAGLINYDSVVDDLELEAAAFLYLAGQGDLVDEFFIEQVIAAQNTDGGWAVPSESESNWHSSVLGLLLLLHLKYPADSYPPVLAPAWS